MALWEWALLLVGGVTAGAINTLAGGGSLLTVPLLVMVGLPPNVANGTNRIAVLVQSLVASATFHKKGLSGVGPGLALVPAGLVGAAVGAYLGTELSDDVFRRIFGVIMVPMALVIVLRPNSAPTTAPSERHAVAMQIAYFFVGAYAGFIQAGVGVFALAALTIFGGFDLKKANAVKVVTVAAFTAVALAIFAIRLDLAVGIGLALSVATGIGGYLGSIAALRKGDRLIRAVMLLACAGLSVRMLVG